MANLEGMKVAILVADGFEQVELIEPRQALDEAGADTSVVSPEDDRVRGWNFTDWGDEAAVDAPLDRVRPHDFDALLLPGGVINPDTLRILPERSRSYGPSSTPASRWHRSATVHGR
jgi:deglycase